jgi:hypothetical protein
MQALFTFMHFNDNYREEALVKPHSVAGVLSKHNTRQDHDVASMRYSYTDVVALVLATDQEKVVLR